MKASFKALSCLGLALAGAAVLADPALAQDAPAVVLDKGDNAWVMTSTVLVLMMTIPGLALFYAGMVRKKNVLATLMQSFATCAIVSIVWMVVGYSIAFTPGGDLNAYIGGFDRLFLSGMEVGGLAVVNGTTLTIPESTFMMFQATFAIITPALIAGAFADRMKFSAMCVFMALWSVIVYSPVAHWVWGGGFLGSEGVLDYAGGTVVHINAGVAGLVAAIVLGKRIGYGKEPMAPHNLVLSLIGASLLWVGWFGFNAGSAVAADGRAGMAFAATHMATAAAALAWMFAEWIAKGKPSVLGAISGAVAGLVAVTPAAGFVLPTGAVAIGLVAGIICFWSATSLKHMLGYDDSLDAFGVHGVGGLVGAILTGVFAVGAVGGDAAKGLIDGNPGQVLTQIEGCVATIVWSAVATLVILKVIDWTMGLRVDEDTEREGLDLALHGETVP